MGKFKPRFEDEKPYYGIKIRKENILDGSCSFRYYTNSAMLKFVLEEQGVHEPQVAPCLTGILSGPFGTIEDIHNEIERIIVNINSRGTNWTVGHQYQK